MRIESYHNKNSSHELRRAQMSFQRHELYSLDDMIVIFGCGSPALLGTESSGRQVELHALGAGDGGVGGCAAADADVVEG